jgi:hypothetical protein
MSVATLVAGLAARGVELWAEDGQLRFRGPAGALTDEDKAALRARREALARFLSARAAAPRPLRPAPEPGTLLPSPNQRVWWELVHGLPDQLRMERVPFVLPLASATPGQAETAVRDLVARTPALLSRFTAGADGPVLSLNPLAGFAVEHIAAPDAAALPAAAMAFVMRPHPVDGPWLTRAAVVAAPGGPTCIVLCFHHILFDGTSLGLAADALKRSLSGLPPAGTPADFLDYAAWERAWFDSGAAAPLIDYWRAWLAETPRLRAPGGRDLRWEPGARIDHPLTLPAGTGGALAAQAAAARTTPFAVILAVFAQALAGWSGQACFPIRCIGDLRTTQALAGTIGLLICADALAAEVPVDGDVAALARALAAEYEAAMAVRLPTHPAGTGAGYAEFHEQIAATVNYVPAAVLRRTALAPGETEAAREAPWPGPPNKAQRLEWPVALPSIFLRLWEVETGLTGRLEFNEALLTPDEQADLVKRLEAGFADLLFPGGEKAGPAPR